MQLPLDGITVLFGAERGRNDEPKRQHGAKFGFRGLSLESMGLKGTKPTDFVRQVLRLVEPDERPSLALHRAVHQAFGSIH